MTFSAVLLFAVSWQIISRHVVQVSTPWTTELASYSFVWLAMIAISLGVRRGRHMLLDVWEYLPYRRWVRIAVETAATLVVIAVLAALVWFGLEGLPTAFKRTISSLGIPFGFVTLAVPFGAACSLIFAIEAWWRVVRSPEGTDLHPSGVLFEPADPAQSVREI